MDYSPGVRVGTWRMQFDRHVTRFLRFFRLLRHFLHQSELGLFFQRLVDISKQLWYFRWLQRLRFRQQLVQPQFIRLRLLFHQPGQQLWLGIHRFRQRHGRQLFNPQITTAWQCVYAHCQQSLRVAVIYLKRKQVTLAFNTSCIAG